MRARQHQFRWQHPQHACRQSLHRKAKRLQHALEQLVLLEAVATAPGVHQLAEHGLLSQRHPLALPAVEVLEGDVLRVQGMQLTQRGFIGARRAGEADAREVGVQISIVEEHGHRSSL